MYAALGRKGAKGMKAEDEKEPRGDRWPFQTMRNSGDKGGTRAREWKETASREDESGGEIEREEGRREDRSYFFEEGTRRT